VAVINKFISKVVVIGLGYVGTSIALMLAKNNKVLAIDIDNEKVNLINQSISPIHDKDIPEFIRSNELDIKAKNFIDAEIINSKMIFISTPTNFDEARNTFDTSSLEDVIEKINNIDSQSNIVIKSTVPIGFTEDMQKKYKTLNIIFSPEFLREGSALYDNLHPSRIVVGGNNKLLDTYINLMKDAAEKKDISSFKVSSSEGEAIKLFSNTFLALKISFFNELDTFAYNNNLSPKAVIEGICADNRIGNNYNNPSFGYGGYCLPKDTKQLQSEYKNLPQETISASIKSNETRKNFIVNSVIDKNVQIIGVYRLLMKSGSDNHRESSTVDIILKLLEQNIKVIVFEPTLINSHFLDLEVFDDLVAFTEKSELILANRVDDQIKFCEDKVFTRDIFGIN